MGISLLESCRDILREKGSTLDITLSTSCLFQNPYTFPMGAYGQYGNPDGETVSS